MPSNFIDLVVTSPPYDDMRKYKGDTFNINEVAQLAAEESLKDTKFISRSVKHNRKYAKK